MLVEFGRMLSIVASQKSQQRFETGSHVLFKAVELLVDLLMI